MSVKMKRFYFLVLALAAMSAVSCTEDRTEESPLQPEEPKYELIVSAGMNSSRATFETDEQGQALESMVWEDSDKIGLAVILSAESWNSRPNVEMSRVAGEELFAGDVTPLDPANRTEDWALHAYYPYVQNRDYNVWVETTWNCTLPTQQVQQDSHHSNYKNYTLMTTATKNEGFVTWSKEDSERPALAFTDRMAALRFKVKPDEELNSLVADRLAAERIEKLTLYVVTADESRQKSSFTAAADAQTHLSGSYTYNCSTGAVTVSGGWDNSTKKIEVELAEGYDLYITPENEEYIWAVIPPFTLLDSQWLVVEIATASYRCIYTYDRSGDFSFTGNNFYNFNKVKITEEGVVGPALPTVTTLGYELGAATLSQAGYYYPSTTELTMSVDFTSEGSLFAEDELKYYIRYGYGTDMEHSGLNLPYTPEVEEKVTWADEMSIAGFDAEAAYAATKQGGTTTCPEFVLVADVAEALDMMFTSDHLAVYQAYAVHEATNTTLYGNVMHMKKGTYPTVDTMDSIVGVMVEDTTDGLSYPANGILIGEVTLPSVANTPYTQSGLQYYIRFGFGEHTEHSGMDMFYTPEVEENVHWAHELADTSKSYTEEDYKATLDDIMGSVAEISLVITDKEILKAAFASGHIPVFQAYVKCPATGETFYGDVAHVDLTPDVIDFPAEVNEIDPGYNPDGNESNARLRMMIPAGYSIWFHSGTINTITSLRMYRREIPEERREAYLNGEMTLEEAVEGVTGELVINKDATSLPASYTGYAFDPWQSAETYIGGQAYYCAYIGKYENGTQVGYLAASQAKDTSTQQNRDEWGAWTYIMQAYNTETHQVVWLRSSRFRLVDVVVAN